MADIDTDDERNPALRPWPIYDALVCGLALCPECGCFVHPDQKQRHGEWHLSLVTREETGG